jgi:pimeloyl-ACP methyl ester carboxylesterase
MNTVGDPVSSRGKRLEIISRLPSASADGVPLLFVHGAFCGAWVWDQFFMPYFAGRGFAAHAVSLRGHGGSALDDPSATIGLDDFVDDVAEAVRHIGEPPVLVGHSMGGMVVQKFARQHPVRGLALMASVPPYGLFPSLLTMTVSDPVLLTELSLLGGADGQNTLPAVFRRALFSSDVDDREVEAWFLRMRGEYQRVVLELMRPDLLQPWTAAKVPVLVMGAHNDAFVSTAQVRATARAHDVAARIFPNMAHAMMLEPRWQQVADHMLGWLRRLCDPNCSF